LSISRSTRRGL